MSRILFIDANMYLDLFRTNSGKQLLDTLEEQQQYIFVTKQIVWEVERDKVRIGRHLSCKETVEIGQCSRSRSYSFHHGQHGRSYEETTSQHWRPS